MRRTSLVAISPIGALVVLLAVVLAWPYLNAPRVLEQAENELVEAIRLGDVAQGVMEQISLWTTYAGAPAASRPRLMTRIREVDDRTSEQLEQLVSGTDIGGSASFRELLERYEALRSTGRRVIALVDAGEGDAVVTVVAGRLSSDVADTLRLLRLQVDRHEAEFRVHVLEEGGELSGFGPLELGGLEETLHAAVTTAEHRFGVAQFVTSATHAAAGYALATVTRDRSHLIAAEVASEQASRAARTLAQDVAGPRFEADAADIVTMIEAHADLAGTGSQLATRAVQGQSGEKRGPLLAQLPTLTQRLQTAATAVQDDLDTALEAKVDSIQSVTTRVQLVVGGAMVMVLAGLVMMTLRVSRRVVDPVVDLQRAAERVAAGDFDVAVSTARNDELGRLARRFNAMVAELDAGRRALVSDAVVATSSDLIAVVGSDLSVTWANRSEWVGSPSAPLVGKDIRTLLPGAPPGRVAGLVEQAEQEGEAGPVELQLRDDPDDLLVVEVSATDLRSDPSVGGIVMTSRDVTDRRRYEEALASARDAALEASRAKSNFLATMSHEIRTPLNAVIGMSGLLADTELDRDQRRYASGIRTAGESLLHLINDILDFSKIEAGRLELEDVDTDVERIIEEVAELFTAGAHARGLQIYSYLHPDVPRRIRADAGRLRQILVNLVGNAVKFTDEGKIIVRARLDREAATLRFEIIDTGIGIDPDMQQQLFESFTQADTATTRRHGGTGLGLAICRQLVELMEGQLGVKSSPGKGSTFWFTLPLRAAEDEAPRRSLQPLARSRVLVIDDDDVNREIAKRQTAAWGMRPVVAGEAHEALRLLTDAVEEDDPFHVALLDLRMPEVDGIDLARRIRRQDRLRDLPLILLTSEEIPDALVRASGVQQRLHKPVRQSQLYDALMSALLPPKAPESPDSDGDVASEPAARDGLVLLVEDNPANQLVGAKTLEKLGYRPDVASHGREALDAIERQEYDAVLMDCQMPVMDGYRATEELRRREAGTNRHIPVIALTAGVTVDDRNRCLEAGMDDFVGKPLRLEDLDGALQRWVAHPEAATQDEDDGTRGGDDVDPAVVDQERWEELLELIEHDRAALADIVGAFVKGAPGLVDSLRSAVLDDDAQALGKAAHRLKGAAANIGAYRISGLAAELEADAGDGKGDDRRDALDELEGWMPRTLAALEDAVGSISSDA